MAPYFVVPRAKSHRVVQGVAAGAVGGVVAMAFLLVMATGMYWPVRNSMFITFGGYVVASVGISWMMSMLSTWTDKKRAQLDEKRAAKQSSVDTKKVNVKLDAKGRPIRVHRYNRKKR